ncbi:hypothetical protein ACFL6D_05330, partial [Spirochaetota bacterium]
YMDLIADVVSFDYSFSALACRIEYIKESDFKVIFGYEFMKYNEYTELLNNYMQNDFRIEFDAFLKTGKWSGDVYLLMGYKHMDRDYLRDPSRKSESDDLIYVRILYGK